MICQDRTGHASTPDRWRSLVISRCPSGSVHTGIACTRLCGGESACTRSVGYTVADLSRFRVGVVLLVASFLVPLLTFTIG